MRVTITNDQGEVFEILTWHDGTWTDSTGDKLGDHDEHLFGKCDDDFPLAGTEIATMIRDARRYFGVEVAK